MLLPVVIDDCYCYRLLPSPTVTCVLTYITRWLRYHYWPDYSVLIQWYVLLICSSAMPMTKCLLIVNDYSYSYSIHRLFWWRWLWWWRCSEPLTLLTRSLHIYSVFMVVFCTGWWCDGLTWLLIPTDWLWLLITYIVLCSPCCSTSVVPFVCLRYFCLRLFDSCYGTLTRWFDYTHFLRFVALLHLLTFAVTDLVTTRGMHSVLTAEFSDKWFYWSDVFGILMVLLCIIDCSLTTFPIRIDTWGDFLYSMPVHSVVRCSVVFRTIACCYWREHSLTGGVSVLVISDAVNWWTDTYCYSMVLFIEPVFCHCWLTYLPALLLHLDYRLRFLTTTLFSLLR